MGFFGKKEAGMVLQGGGLFWQRGVVGLVLACVVGCAFVSSLVLWPQVRSWSDMTPAERTIGHTLHYLGEPILAGLYVFLVGPLIAWALTRRWIPHAAPRLLVVVVATLLANVVAAALVALLHLRISDGSLRLGERLADASVRVAVLFCAGVVATLTVTRPRRTDVGGSS